MSIKRVEDRDTSIALSVVLHHAFLGIFLGNNQGNDRVFGAADPDGLVFVTGGQ